MIRVLVLDDHPALRAGLETVLGSEPDLVLLAAAADEYELWPALERTRPDVVVLDYHLAGDDGMQLCLRIKRRLLPPRVIVYTAYAGAAMAAPARVAGADALVRKDAPAHELLGAIRAVARGEQVLPPLDVDSLREASARLDPEDRPILPMLLEGTPSHEVAAALRIDERQLADRMARIVKRLRVNVPTGAR